MLTRTANNLYWMAATSSAPRTPRACSTSPTACRCCRARSRELQDQEWFAPLNITGTLLPVLPAATASVCARRTCCTSWRSTRTIRPRIYSCARSARENARAVRGAITSEMWEVLNTTWLEMQQMDEDAACTRAASPTFFDWVKDALATCSAASPSAPCCRDEAYHFSAPRHLPGARRQHRAHPRREVPHPAAEREGRRRRGRLLPVVGGAALGVAPSSPTARSTAT